MSAVAARGEVTDAGIENLNASLFQLPLYGRDMEAVDKALRSAAALSERYPDDALVRACAAIPAARHPAAFILGADLVLAEGAFDRPERTMLEAFRQCLGLDEEFANKVIDVMHMKHATGGPSPR